MHQVAIIERVLVAFFAVGRAGCVREESVEALSLVGVALAPGALLPLRSMDLTETAGDVS